MKPRVMGTATVLLLMFGILLCAQKVDKIVNHQTGDVHYEVQFLYQPDGLSLNPIVMIDKDKGIAFRLICYYGSEYLVNGQRMTFNVDGMFLKPTLAAIDRRTVRRTIHESYFVSRNDEEILNLCRRIAAAKNPVKATIYGSVRNVNVTLRKEEVEAIRAVLAKYDELTARKK